MRAIRVTEFGGPEVLTVVDDAAVPVPGEGQVLIEVAYAGPTFVETQLRSGNPPHAAMLPALPMVPGNGVGGTVRAVGPGADPGLVGRRVVSGLTGRGGYAEYAVAAAATVVPVPDGLGLDVATALLADGRTARFLRDALAAEAPLAGRTVLLAPAAGGVGCLLVALLARDGATVVAAAGGAEKTALAASRGARHTVDYTAPDWTSTVPGPVDVLLDGVGGELGDTLLSLVRRGGSVLAFGAAAGRMGTAPQDAGRPDVHTVRPEPLTPDRQVRLVGEALADAAAGEVIPVIGRTFPLADAAAAHAAMENRSTLGKTLLAVR